MKTYELSYIISPEITMEEASAKAKDIELAIQSREGTILKQQNPIAKTLAFPVGKKASGFLGFIEFKIEPEKLLEIKEIVAKDGKIVRHMVIIKEAQRIRKERKGKAKAAPLFEVIHKTETKHENEKPASVEGSVETKEKVELKDIDQQLEELLG